MIEIDTRWTIARSFEGSLLLHDIAPGALPIMLRCEHKGELRERTILGGRKQWKVQCVLCGDYQTDSKPKPTSQAPAFDEDAFRACSAGAERWREDSYFRQSKARQAEARAERSAYYATPQWAKLRQKVIARCGNRCEGCGEAAVDEVHHTTYDNFGNEFLFELLGLCRPCHERLHDSYDAHKREEHEQRIERLTYGDEGDPS